MINFDQIYKVTNLISKKKLNMKHWCGAHASNDYKDENIKDGIFKA